MPADETARQIVSRYRMGHWSIPGFH